MANFKLTLLMPQPLVVLGSLVPVVRGLVGTLNWNADVVSLRLGELGQPGTKLAQVEGGHLLVEVLGKNVPSSRTCQCSSPSTAQAEQ